MTNKPKILILAGPNGAGKTTFAREFLPQEADCLTFINADLIAAGLAPFKPEAASIQAGRLMLKEIEQCVKQRQSFAFETTLSGLTYAKKILAWREMGYIVELFFLSLPSVELAIHRVHIRVVQGGHFIPEAIIRRRFFAGLENFESCYKKLVNAWVLYDNAASIPVMMDKGENHD